MKREDLTTLGISAENIDKIMKMHGDDIENHKRTITSLTTERDELKKQLTEANEKLKGYDPEWQKKAEQATRDAQAKVEEATYKAAATAAISGLKFTSESAKKAFLGELIAKKLPMQDDKLLGMDDFINFYKKTDPGAFASDTKPPAISGPTPGPAQGAQTKNEAANKAIREAFGRGSKQTTPTTTT